jgi:riboflavin synthase
MFTGLVEAMGMVERGAGVSRLRVRAGGMAETCSVGESVAVNGCCLTVVEVKEGRVDFDLLEETLRRTNLVMLGAGDRVNLERALRADGRVGGHFVQGHVDCVARVMAWTPVRLDYRMEVELPKEYARYVVEKGSIAVDGISLTVAELKEDRFTVWIIPHTREVTDLGGEGFGVGSLVNLEFDMLAKYVERLLGK